MKKNLNAATMLSVDIAAVLIMIIAAMTAVAVALYDPSDGARPGEILAKSDLTKQQLSKLHVMPVSMESRHALR